MPIYMSGCIVFTMPIWSSFMAFFILKESLSKYNVLGLFFTFAGVLIINDPFGFFSINDQERVYSQKDLFIGTAYALVGAIAGSCVYILLRRLKNVHFTYSPFWFSFGCVMWSPFSNVFINTVAPD